MTINDDIDAAQRRISKAEKERDAFHVAGMQERYLEAYSMVDALNLQIDQLYNQQRNLRMTNASQSVGCDIPHPPKAPPSSPLISYAIATQAPELEDTSISFDGRHYRYDGFRYDRREDAMNYARLQRGKRSHRSIEAAAPEVPWAEAPNDSQRRLMQAFGITVENGQYHFREYRYDRVADAIAYAQLPRMSPPRP